MESKAKFLGHPIHPMLIVFPLGLLATAVIFDVITLTSGNPLWTSMGFYLIAAGLIGGVIASVFGVIDFLAIPTNTRAKTIAMMHGAVNLVVLLLFFGSWFLRRQTPTAPSDMALTLGFIGVGLSFIAGWLGGELVDRLGVGVDPGAHLNAPSSLSGRPAEQQDMELPAHQAGRAH